MSIEKNKLMCGECDHFCTSTEILKATNPFDQDDTLIFCPNCKSVNTMICICDEPGCLSKATCGTPSADGYRNTCLLHFRPINA